MILTVAEPGPLRVAIQDALHAMGEVTKAAHAGADDLFMQALGCRAILYVPEANILEASVRPRPDPERMRAIVRAANAPSVKLVVVVEPNAEAYSVEERVLKRDGVPYVVVRTPALLEELAEAANFHAMGTLWLSRGEPVAFGSASALGAAVRDALTRDDVQGATLDVPTPRLEIAEAVRRAATVAGAKVHVRVVPPRVSTVLRRLSGWVGIDSPDVEGLVRRTTASAA